MPRRPGDPMVGDVRRDPDNGCTVVYARRRRPQERAWLVIGEDPNPMGGGWRTAPEVERWQRMGNVFRMPRWAEVGAA